MTNENSLIDSKDYKIRKRRSDLELVKDLVCPFESCNKKYCSRTALKLHIKRRHKLNDPIKKNYPCSLLSIITTTMTKGVRIHKVVKRKRKLEPTNNKAT